MDFSFEKIGYSNLFTADFNAVTFSIAGMVVIFSGLVFISLYIVLLPSLLRFFERKGKHVKTPVETVEASDFQEKELLLAIAAAFHLHQNFPEENQKITWKSHGDVDSPWQMSGKVHGLSQRNLVKGRDFFHR